jgi:hypothetical protein
MVERMLLGILLCCAVQAQAQMTANATLAPAHVETGDTFTMRVMVSGTNVEPREVNFHTWAAVPAAPEVLSHSGWRKSGPQWVQQFTLIAFDSATLSLPPVTVKFHLGDSVRTNALQLLVTPTQATPDLAAMDTVRDIRREGDDWTDYWPVAVVLLVLLIAGRWYLLRKKPKPQPVAAPVAVQPAVPVHEQTLAKLKALEHQKPWQKGQIKEYYVDLSMIMREYLERRFNIPALESTTREILSLLKTTSFPEQLQPTIRDMLMQADLAKYAQGRPPDAFHEKALQNARLMVHQTTSNTPGIQQKK